MVVIMRPNATEAQITEVLGILKNYDVKTDLIRGDECTIIGLIGNTRDIDQQHISIHPAVDHITLISEPYKKANRKSHPEDTVVEVMGRYIGGEKLAIMAGPCSVETQEQLLETAESVKKSGAHFLRGGAYKPRTSPYAFSGLKLDGLELLKTARDITGLPIVTEIVDTRLVEVFERDVDVIQVGARNMRNFPLLKELGQTRKPVLLKRDFCAPIEEFLMSAEHILAQGNGNVILCERGIRSFETYTRNTLDLSAIPLLKHHSHLPIIIDPSHATGLSWMVPRMSKAAVAAGADGLIIEVHNNPKKALCDGAQSLDLEQFAQLMKELGKYAELENRTL